MPTPPSQASGYSLVFDEEFSALNLSGVDGNGNYTWYRGLWYQTQSQTANVAVSGGVLDLKWTSGQSPSSDTSIQTYSHDHTTGQAWKYGYFEASLKYDVAAGAWPAFWLNGDYGGATQRFTEIDIFEGQGTDGKIYCTLHDWKTASGSTTDQIQDNANTITPPAGTDLSQFHTYGVLWTPGTVKFYFDNVLVRTASTPASADSGPNLYLILSMQTGGWNAGSPTASSLNTYFDWVRVWQPSGSGSGASLPNITTASLPGATVGTGYSQTVAATGGASPYAWTVANGALPTGLSLAASTGALTGAPTTAGTYSFTLQVTDANAKTATASFSITAAAAAGSRPTISTAALSNATAGTAYSASLAASGGTSPYTWTVSSGSLPAGLSLNAATGALTGTPTVLGSSSLVVRVTDANAQTGSASFALTVVAAGSATILAPAQISSGYTLNFDDEFDTLDLSSDGTGTHNWYPGLWYGTPPPAAQFADAGSVATLTWSAATGQTETQMSTLAKDGVSGRTFQYGYFEARMKWDVATGAWPVFRLDSGLNGQTTTTSIDVFQGQAAAPHTYNATIAAYTGSTQTFRSAPNTADLGAANDFSQWHTYGVLWTPGQVTWYFDNVAVLSSSVPAASDAQSYYLILGMLEGVSWNEGSTTGVTAANIRLQVDWVRVWKNTGAAAPPAGSGTGTGTSGSTATGAAGTTVTNASGANTPVAVAASYQLPYHYPGYLTSEYQGSTRLVAWLNAATAKLDDALACLAQFPALFDLDTGAGNPLDILGQMIGQGRVVGFQPTSNVSPRLDDATYKILLKARIAQNQWDGRIDSLQTIWQSLFPGGSLVLQDAQNMTVTVILSGAFTSIVQDLIRNGYIVPRPEGVLYNFSFGQTPQFGTDQQNDFIAGWDLGHLS